MDARSVAVSGAYRLCTLACRVLAAIYVYVVQDQPGFVELDFFTSPLRCHQHTSAAPCMIDICVVRLVRENNDKYKLRARLL